jgi:membrane-associated phospholipid phosphatase
VSAEETASDVDSGSVPFFSTLFYKFGINTLHSFTSYYGINYAAAGLGTWLMIESGVDWEWNRLAVHNKAMAYAGSPAGVIGILVPIGLPLGMYFYGKSKRNSEFQITALALGQAAMQGLLVSSAIKAFTGRRSPEIFDRIISGEMNAEDFSRDFAWGFMKRGVFYGWPSGHTMVAFAMAAVLAELYPYKTGLKIGAYSYATLIGLGMSVFGHWASDSVAGALIGLSVGKSVGSSYKSMRDDPGASSNPSGAGELAVTEKISVRILPDNIGMIIRY